MKQGERWIKYKTRQVITNVNRGDRTFFPPSLVRVRKDSLPEKKKKKKLIHFEWRFLSTNLWSQR